MMQFTQSIRRFFSLLLVFLIVISTSLTAAPSFPAPTSYKYINDYSGILKTEELQNFSLLGQELETQTGAEAVVVLIDSTGGIPIEDYANKLFRTWGIGKKGQDNGLLLLIAIKDQTWRVEVGRGLEGAIPDALSHQIMETYAKPAFSLGNYSQGILQAYTVFSEQIATEYGVTLNHSFVPPPFYQPPPPARHSNSWVWILVLLLFADLFFNRGRIFSNFFALLFWSNIGRRGGGPRGGGGGFGGGSSNGGGSSGSW
ncbi:MAG: TPM domain-containing protein [Cellulosilyticaceae bacterium]